MAVKIWVVIPAYNIV